MFPIFVSKGGGYPPHPADKTWIWWRFFLSKIGLFLDKLHVKIGPRGLFSVFLYRMSQNLRAAAPPHPPPIKILPVNENIDFDEISSRSRRISYLCFLIFIPLGRSLLKILSAKHSIEFDEISSNSTFLFLHFYCSIGAEPPRVPPHIKISSSTRSH